MYAWISIEQSVMVSGIVCLHGGSSFVIGQVQLSLLIMGEGLTTKGHLIVVLILLKVG